MMTRPEKRWIVAGNYAIDADSILYINTAARFLAAPEGDDVRDAWGEVPSSRLVERSGVEVVLLWMREQPPLRFLDGTPEAEDLRTLVRKSADRQEI